MATKLVPLCRCNKCMRIYEDTNPQVSAAEFRVPKSLPSLTDIDDQKACPECNTDGYLSDVGLVINSNVVIEDEFPTIHKLIKWCEKGIREAENLNRPVQRKMFVHFKKTIYKFLS